MDYLFKLDASEKRTLQHQLRDQIANAIIDGRIAPKSAMPSSRRLSEQLGVSRNTVMLAYATLQEEGFLTSRERSGHFVCDSIDELKVAAGKGNFERTGNILSSVDWKNRLVFEVSQQRNINKPSNWREFDYCFVYGQLNPGVFPVRHWRDCWLDAVGVQEISGWSQDFFDRDDMMLVDQIRTKLLPRRGLWVDESQILVTVGAQNALYIAMRLLLNGDRKFGIEEPGYPDARNIAQIFTDKITPLAVDDQGLVPDDNLTSCDLVYLTPSHQSPTTVTMPKERRRALLDQAERDDFLLLEDDYESEISFSETPLPALMSDDTSGRIIYIGSLSKTLAPGLRLGYLVGPPAFIAEARALRRLIMRHPATNNQRAAAFFLSRGYHESLLRSLVATNKKKWRTLLDALETHLPAWRVAPSRGGSSFWISGPDQLDARMLAEECENEGVLIEPGDVHFCTANPPLNSFRLGYTSIPLERIEEGIKRIANIAKRHGLA